MGVRVCPFSYALARAGNPFYFVYPLYEVAMHSRQNVRTLGQDFEGVRTPEEKLVRREIRNEKDRARRRRAKTKQKQVAK